MNVNEPEDFLRYYQSELTWLRQMGSAFAGKYPGLAARLELSADTCPDPHVERLLESFAFLTGRIQQDIDGEFPEITTALLGILYPHFVSPIPAMTIAQFEPDPDQGKLTTGHLIKRQTPVFAQAADDLICRFRTCYPVTLWPLEVVAANFARPAQYDFLDSATQVASVLHLQLESRGVTLPELELDRLRFYLHGDRVLTQSLYELIFGHACGVALLKGEDKPPVWLPPAALQPVGFGREEEVLPAPGPAHPGYRLLQEYFTFPEKFLFFDLNNLDARGDAETLSILILLDHQPKERLVIESGTFRLGCTPLINLFPKTTEPIRLDHRQVEYPLIADKRRERTTEIHSILKVSAASASEDETRTFEPFYSYNHHAAKKPDQAFWYARRRATGRMDLPGTDVCLSFVDLDFHPCQPPTQTVYAHTLCTNRDLAEQLTAGARLQLDEGAPLQTITCLKKPSRQLYPPLRGATLWRLISHLSLNHLSLAGGRESLHALREILRLYNFADHPSLQQQITGISDMSVQPALRHIGHDAWRGFCRGVAVRLEFDESLYVGSSAFLLGAVLNNFFALYASVNSFTQLTITSKQREGVWKQWPPMAGEKIVM